MLFVVQNVIFNLLPTEMNIYAALPFDLPVDGVKHFFTLTWCDATHGLLKGGNDTITSIYSKLATESIIDKINSLS